MTRLLTACAVVLASCALLFGCSARNGDVLLRLDPLDPLCETLEEQNLEYELLRDRPLMQRATAFEGLLFVSGLQAGMLKNTGLSYKVILEKPCMMVIAVNRTRTEETVTGYEQLLETGLVVATPHQDSDAGKTLVQALSQARNAEDGDWRPGFDYLATLKEQNRLLISAVLDNENLTLRLAGEADAVLCWDYQAETLEQNGDWQIVIPQEGSFRSAQLLLATSGTDVPAALADALRLNGWAEPESASADVPTATISALSTFKADFRRMVIAGTRRYSTASVPEKVAVNGGMLLLMLAFYVDIGLHMRTRLVLGPFVALSGSLLVWLLLSLIKLLVWSETAVLALWYGFYPCMLTAAMAWYALSYALRHEKHLPRRAFALMAVLLVFFSVLVSTDLLHEKVFRFHDKALVFWYNNYDYGWGYWAFFSTCGLFLLAGLYEYGRYTFARRERLSFLSFFIGLALILTLNLLNTFHVSNGLYLDIAWQTNLLAAMALFAALRARFLDPAVHWDRLFNRMQFAVGVWNGSAAVYESDAFRRIEPTFYAKNAAADGARKVNGEWFRAVDRDTDGLHMTVLENVSDQIAAQQALQARHMLAEQNRQLAEQRLAKSRAMLESFSLIVQDAQYNRLLRNGMESLEKQLDRLCADSEIEKLRCAQFVSGHCSRVLRLMLWAMERGAVPADELGVLLNGGCIDAQRCGLSVTLSCKLETALGAKAAIAVEHCFTQLLLAFLPSPHAIVTIRLQTTDGAVRMVALLSKTVDLSILYEAASSFAVSVEQQADDNTTILKLRFPGGAP